MPWLRDVVTWILLFGVGAVVAVLLQPSDDALVAFLLFALVFGTVAGLLVYRFRRTAAIERAQLGRRRIGPADTRYAAAWIERLESGRSVSASGIVPLVSLTPSGVRFFWRTVPWTDISRVTASVQESGLPDRAPSRRVYLHQGQRRTWTIPTSKRRLLSVYATCRHMVHGRD